MKKLIYLPQPNATIDEAMQVMKMWTYCSLPPEVRTIEMLFKIYNSLPDNAKRHFKMVEEKD